MTDDKGARGVKYIHSLTWDLDGCKNDCPKCAYEKGRASRDGLRKALEEAQQFVVDQIVEIGACDHSVGHCECEVIRLAENTKKALEADGEYK